jgi:hypothetical protein
MADREALRQEMETTRTAFMALADSLTGADWRAKTANPAWNVGQLMWHVAWGTGAISGSVDGLKKGKGFSPPSFIANPANRLMTKWGSRKATRESVKQLYDNGHRKALAALEGVKDDEWARSAKVFGTMQSVESLFRTVAEHFQEHERDIKAALSR